MLECGFQVWRGYVQKRRAKIAREEEKVFLKMVSIMHPCSCSFVIKLLGFGQTISIFTKEVYAALGGCSANRLGLLHILLQAARQSATD